MQRSPINRRPRVLFLQVADPAYYPPLIHAASLFAEGGWGVDLLSAPIAGSTLVMPERPGITLHRLPARPTHVVSKRCYASYLLAAARLARRLRPDLVYASDFLSCGPALLAARISKAKLIYHEHDTPERSAPNTLFDRLRRAALRRADIVVFPNETRARLVSEAAGVDDDRLSIVWNLPQKDELPKLHHKRNDRLVLYYHGSINRERLPESVITSVMRMRDRVKLCIAGYESPGAAGYIGSLFDRAASAGAQGAFEYLGAVPTRQDLLKLATEADVGLALMPRQSQDVNMRFMAGASNKPFDYMAAGLCLIVSDLPEWADMFVAPGYGCAVNPEDHDQVRETIEWLFSHPEERAAMAGRARAKIASDWNYETAFAPVLKRLADV